MKDLSRIIALLTYEELRAIRKGGSYKDGMSRKALTRIIKERDAGISGRKIRKAYEYIRAHQLSAEPDASETEPQGPSFGREGASRFNVTMTEDGRAATVILTTDKEVTTEDEVWEICKMSREEWRMSRIKFWTTPMKISLGDGIQVPHVLYNVHATMERKVDEIDVRRLFDELLSDMKSGIPGLVLSSPPIPGGPFCVVVHLADPHIGGYFPGETYTMDRAVSGFIRAAEYLLKSLSHLNIEEVVLPLGHDMTQIDFQAMTRQGTASTTTSGTLVEHEGTWRELFRATRYAGSEVIKLAAGYADRVVVKVVPGNHDTHTAFGVSEVWRAEFEGQDRILIDNGGVVEGNSINHDDRVYEYGVNAILMAHGKDIRFEDLPGYFASVYPRLWGRSTRREILTGHYHVRRGRPVGTYEEFRGAMVRISPALCPTTLWERKKGYVGALPGAEAMAYDKDLGHFTTINYIPVHGREM